MDTAYISSIYIYRYLTLLYSLRYVGTGSGAAREALLAGNGSDSMDTAYISSIYIYIYLTLLSSLRYVGTGSGAAREALLAGNGMDSTYGHGLHLIYICIYIFYPALFPQVRGDREWCGAGGSVSW